MDQLIAGEPGTNELTSIDVAVPTPDDLSLAPTGAQSNGLFVTASSFAAGTVDAMRAEWQTELIVAATWKAFNTQSLGTIVGGTLVDQEIEPGNAQSAATWFTQDNTAIRFTNQDNQPADLSVSPDSLRETVANKASEAGAQLDATAFGSMIGTDVEIDLTVPNPDPGKWSSLLDGGSILGPGGFRSIEGSFVVIRDGSGKLIKCMSYSTGYEEGGVVYGVGYDSAPYTNNAAGVTPAPTTSAASGNVGDATTPAEAGTSP